MIAVARGVFPVRIPLIVLSTLGAVSPLASLYVIERLSGGEFRLRDVFGQIRTRDASKGWLAASIVAIPLATLAGTFLGSAAGGETGLRILKEGPDKLGWWLLLIIPVQFAAWLFTSPLLEEPGWRGFALVELQEKVPRELASLILGSYWWLWHQPMNIAFGLYPSLYGYVSMVATSFVIDSLYNLSGRNLLAPMLAHQASGTSITFLHSRAQNPFEVGMVVAVAAALRIVEHRRPSARLQARCEEGVEFARSLGVPDGYEHICTVALGYADGPNPPAPPRKRDVVNYVR